MNKELRMLLKSNTHLSYCTNIHPGSDWKTTFDSLKEYVPKIKREISADKKFGLGLRLSNKASLELNKGNNLNHFQEWLSENHLYVFTMNGFPYGNFHNERVKDEVHAPDWTTTERLEYTQRLFEQLAVLLPEGCSGGISTSPISYKHWHESDEAKEETLIKGAEHLTEVIIQLHSLENSTGKYMHLDIEPEPDGLIENSDELLHFFKEYLIPIAAPILRQNLNANINVKEIVNRYITICYDICHFSLAYEEPEDTFLKLKDSGIKIGKIQVSAALKIISDGKGNEEIWESLSAFNEPTYLHQVTELKEGTVHTYNDLPAVLEKRNGFNELRAHFHVPIFLKEFGKLFSTQDHILKVIEILKEEKLTEHLEVETYTWDVLPKSLKKDLSESIVRELQWLKNKL